MHAGKSSAGNGGSGTRWQGATSYARASVSRPQRDAPERRRGLLREPRKVLLRVRRLEPDVRGPRAGAGPDGGAPAREQLLHERRRARRARGREREDAAGRRFGAREDAREACGGGVHRRRRRRGVEERAGAATGARDPAGRRRQP
jgi:hypothetical protein